MNSTTCVIIYEFVITLMWLLCSSYVTLMFLLTKLDEALILNGIITDFAPTLVRRKNGGETNQERRMNEHLSKKHLISFTTILKVQKNRDVQINTILILVLALRCVEMT